MTQTSINYNIVEWVACSDRLPDIPDGQIRSVEVLAGCWITDTWLREDHPDRERFMFGSSWVTKDTDLRSFPMGKRWHTFGPSHNQITHWTYIVPPVPQLLVSGDNKMECRMTDDDLDQLRQDALRWREYSALATEEFIRPPRGEQFLDLRTYWKFPTLICSGPVGGYMNPTEALDALLEYHREADIESNSQP